ncbi:hypothetical protein NQS96_14995 [Pseudoalteromonas shioyasakiensis]|uniref:hypothetical protein n=1 Tax=Pseudoalteromonas TaxID=53246 RepID=UPI00202B7EC7|nr:MULTISPECIES: hypothetical protein [Pseudoalteromonas]MCQ8883082.1 hypothetical protein [Pseudoalteromonas shioyasakiensis]URQ90763.1 hypothetical protein J8Z25_01860 [Pseudoalteromonas sp. SCSIO 43101]
MTTTTSTVNTLKLDSTNAPFSDAALWLKEGWGLFKKAPFKLFLLMTLFAILPGLVQLLPAPIGLTVSKWLAPMLMATVWPLLFNLNSNQGFSFRHNTTWAKWGRVAVWSVVGILLALVQLALGSTLIGSEQLSALLSGQFVDVERWRVGVMFVSIVPMNMLLIFVVPLLLLSNSSLSAAVKESLATALRVIKPLSVLCLINMLVTFAAPYSLLPMLLMGPVLACTFFCAYNRLFK